MCAARAYRRGDCDVRRDEESRMTITAKRKREMQAAGVKFGCFVNVENGDQDEPDNDCCIDSGFRDECVFAAHIRSRESCRYWRWIVEIKDDAK